MKVRTGSILLVLALVAGIVAPRPDVAEAAVPLPPPPDAPLDSAANYQINAHHDGNVPAPLTWPLERAWSVDLGSEVGYPLIVNGRVFVISVNTTGYGTKLWALDQDDGSVIWGPIALSGTYYINGIAADGANIYSVNFNGILRAIDQDTGTEMWSRTLTGEYATTSPPTVEDGVVYVAGGGGGGLYAVDAATGAILWDAPVGGSHSAPAVTDDAVYVSYACGRAHRRNRADGSQVWARTTGCSGGGGKTAVVADDRLYVRDSSYPAVLDLATGAEIGSLSASVAPAFGDDRRFTLSGGTLSATQVSTGLPLWTQAADGALSTAPLVLGDVVAMGSSTGKIFLLDASTGVVLWSAATGSPVAPPDEHNAQVLTGMAAAGGTLVVAATDELVAYVSARTATDTALTSGPNPSTWQQSVTLTAQVSPPPGTGTVRFEDAAGTALTGCEAVPLIGGTSSATCITSALAVGSTSIEARYSGNDTHGPSTGSVLQDVIAPPDGGSISGIVTDRSTDVVDVFALDPVTRDVVAQTTVGPLGTYLLDDLPGGEYVIYFGASSGTWAPSRRSDEAWPNSHDLDAVAPVAVVGDPVTGIDADLELPATVTGTVTADGSAAAGALVEAIPSSSTATQGGSWYALTDGAGQFSIAGLDGGAYVIEVDRDSDDVIDATSGAPIQAPAGTTVDAGTFVVTIAAGTPSQPSSLSAAPGVGQATLIYGLPADAGATPLEYVQVTVWPWWADVVFSDDSLQATATGLLNGATNRFAVAWGNAAGTGVVRTVDAVPTGCPNLWFTDVGAASPFCADIRWLVERGVGGGFSDATFRPTASVSRQAMAAFLYRYAGEPDGADPTCIAAQFGDVPVSHPFCGEIAWLAEEGIASGFADATFRPTASVSRQAMAAFLRRMEGASSVGAGVGTSVGARSDANAAPPPIWAEPDVGTWPRPLTVRVPRR